MAREVEIILHGGGEQQQARYSYKRAALDLSKLQQSADGAILLRVNCPVVDAEIYQVLMPKEFPHPPSAPAQMMPV